MTLITTHPFVALILVALIVALAVLVIVGVLHNSSKQMPEQSDIEPGDLSDPVCSWCQKEQAIKAQPHESHGICERHKNEMIAESKRLNHAA